MFKELMHNYDWISKWSWKWFRQGQGQRKVNVWNSFALIASFVIVLKQGSLYLNGQEIETHLMVIRDFLKSVHLSNKDSSNTM